MTATAIRNLELFANLADGKEEGTLIKVLNQTRTKFGDRLLRKWMSTPLLDKDAIEMRFDAVEEAMKDKSGFFGLVKNALKGMMDLERGLTTIFYKKCKYGIDLRVRRVAIFSEIAIFLDPSPLVGGQSQA